MSMTDQLGFYIANKSGAGGLKPSTKDLLLSTASQLQRKADDIRTQQKQVCFSFVCSTCVYPSRAGGKSRSLGLAAEVGQLFS
jgi:hypothetical protein